MERQDNIEFMSNRIYPNSLKLGRIGFLGMVISVGIFSGKVNAFTTHSLPNLSVESFPTRNNLVADLPNILPPANLPVNSGGVVNVPPVNRPEASIRIAPTSTIVPTTLPPSVFPTNQTPTFSVPPVQPIPATISQPPESLSPNLSTPPVIEFGQPLPKVRG